MTFHETQIDAGELRTHRRTRGAACCDGRATLPLLSRVEKGRHGVLPEGGTNSPVPLRSWPDEPAGRGSSHAPRSAKYGRGGGVVCLSYLHVCMCLCYVHV